MDESLLRLFAETKLNDKQISVYLALLKAGQASVSKIATLAQLKRPNTYVIIAELEVLGYVYPVLGSTKKVYAAADPNKVLNDIKKGIQDLEEMLPFLRAMQKRAGKPHVEYYEGRKGVQQALSQIRRPKEARYAVSIDDAEISIPNEVERWQKTYFSGKARAGGKHLIKQKNASAGFVVALKKGKQIVRYLAQDVDFNIDVALVDGSIYIMSFEDDIHVTVINSEAIYKSMCVVYDLVWGNAKRQNK